MNIICLIFYVFVIMSKNRFFRIGKVILTYISLVTRQDFTSCTLKMLAKLYTNQ